MIRGIRKITGEFVGRNPPVFIFSLVVLFWSIFDGSVSFITPLMMEENGLSNSQIGIIIGASSIFGAIFDFLISKLFKNTNFKRIFLIMFALCLAYPLILWQAKTLWLFLLAMAMWGIYWDLYGFGTFDFISRYTKKEDHSANFGVIQISKAIGTIIAPLIIGLVFVSALDWQPYAIMGLFLGVSFLLFLVLINVIQKYHQENNIIILPRRKNFSVEIHLWKKLSKTMLPVLLGTFFLFFVDAFFWTIGPLFAESISIEHLGGLFLSAYVLPELLTGWFIGPITKKLGKKRTAFLGLLMGSLALTLFFLVSGFISVIILVFIASFFYSFSFPAVNSSYADYISDAPQVEEEIEGLEDFFFNIGYILGPILAGVLSDIFSIPMAFGLLGFWGVILATSLLLFAPKHIIIKMDESEL